MSEADPKNNTDKFDEAFKSLGLKPTTEEQRRKMLEEGFTRGNREEPDNLLLDDELTGQDK